MKLSISFPFTLLLAVAFQSITSSSLTVEHVSDSPTGPVSRLTASQEDALKGLNLDVKSHKRLVDRADPLKVAKFIELHELFKSGNDASLSVEILEALGFFIDYVPCEIAWHLRIIELGETVQCFERSVSWKERTKAGDMVLVNFFADKHVFELIQLLQTTGADDEKLFMDIKEMLSSQGLISGASPAFFLQHALALYKEAPTSPERQEMVANFLSLHLSALATKLHDQTMLKELYAELVQDVSTLLIGNLPNHAIAVVATRKKNDEYDVAIVNSGLGLSNHESTTEIQPKGFHTGASYYDVPAEPDKLIEATFFNPLLRMEGVTRAELASAHYQYGTEDQVYYVAKNASSRVVTEPLMPWEWTEAQGIGSCPATSVWFALHFYYQALGYANEVRLSMLDQAIGDLKELQDKVEDLERQMNADYQKAWKAFKSTRKSKTDHFHYDQDIIRDLKAAKDEAEKSLHLRRTIISMALNEILRNVIVWQHELGDINAELLTKGKEFAKTVQHSKMEQRREVLEKAIPQTMMSFHSFWALQEEKYEKRQREIVDTETVPTSVLDSWQSIRADVRTMYNDAIRVTGIKPKVEIVLAKPPIVKRTFKPINVASLKEHESLSKILGYILGFGDSLALQRAIRDHLQAHKKNANAAKYLIVLYACLAKNVSMLSNLVVAQELPLLYELDRTKENLDVSMYWDLTTEDSIAALAAHEFSQHGQPLDAFPELFKKPQRETQGIVGKFKEEYSGSVPIVNAKAPSKEVDEAFEALVSQGKIAAIACILPQTSKKAISDAFLKTESGRVLRLLVDWVQDQKLLEQKIESNITNVEIVESVLPVYLRDQTHAIEKDLIERQGMPGLTVTGEPTKASVPDQWLASAYAENAGKAIEFLAPFSNESAIAELLLTAISDRNSAMACLLARCAAADAILAAIEEAGKQGHADMAKTLFEEYARKKPAEAAVLTAAEQGSVDELEDWILRVGADTIGYALFKAAEKGKMGCFGRLVPHATGKSISAALSKVSDENSKDLSVLKAVNNASKFLDYKEIAERAVGASNLELVVGMLPFMHSWDVNALFKSACKNAKSFEITKHLLQFADSVSAEDCLEAAVNGKMEDSVSLLLPRVKREKLAKISQSLKFKELGKETRQAVADRIEGFPTEVAIELAFFPDDKYDISALKKELREYNIKSGKDKDHLACNSQETCIDEVGKNPSALVFPVEQAIGLLVGRTKDSAALGKLAPFATPYACGRIISPFSQHGNKEAIRACAPKVLKSEVSAAVKSAQRSRNFELMKLFVPFLPPLGIIWLLEPSFFEEKVDAAHLKDMLADLPCGLADDALRIAVRGNKQDGKKIVHDLLPKASQAAIDEVYLFAKRIKFDDTLLEKAASGTAKAQGREIERGRSAK